MYATNHRVLTPQLFATVTFFPKFLKRPLTHGKERDVFCFHTLVKHRVRKILVTENQILTANVQDFLYLDHRLSLLNLYLMMQDRYLDTCEHNPTFASYFKKELGASAVYRPCLRVRLRMGVSFFNTQECSMTSTLNLAFEKGEKRVYHSN
jgi:hypothetical protein